MHPFAAGFSVMGVQGLLSRLGLLNTGNKRILSLKCSDSVMMVTYIALLSLSHIGRLEFLWMQGCTISIDDYVARMQCEIIPADADKWKNYHTSLH